VRDQTMLHQVKAAAAASLAASGSRSGEHFS
jgi:hypothetical protein